MRKLVGLVVVASVLGCNNAGFKGNSDKYKDDPEPTINNPETPSEDPEDPVDTPLIPDLPSVTIDDTIEAPTFTIKDIADQSVNSGHLSYRYSETLTVPVQFSGGKAPMELTVDMPTVTSNYSVANGVFTWRPGVLIPGGYDPELGEHTVSITVKDSAGEVISTSFKITVVPVTWSSKVSGDNQEKMTVEYSVIEKLHDTRTYEHDPVYKSQNLNAATCKSIVGAADIVLDDKPTVVADPSPVSGADGTEHKLTLSIPHHVDQQPHDKTVYLTRLNLLFNDDGKLADKDNGIFIYYAFARCRGSNLSQSECKKQAITENGKNNFYYCSDYLPSGDFAADTNSIFCGIAKHNGLKPSGC